MQYLPRSYFIKGLIDSCSRLIEKINCAPLSAANCRCSGKSHCPGPSCNSKDICYELNQIYESWAMFSEPDMDYTTLKIKHLEKSQRGDLPPGEGLHFLKNVLNCDKVHITSNLPLEPFLSAQPGALGTFTLLGRHPRRPLPELSSSSQTETLCLVSR